MEFFADSRQCLGERSALHFIVLNKPSSLATDLAGVVGLHFAFRLHVPTRPLSSARGAVFALFSAQSVPITRTLARLSVSASAAFLVGMVGVVRRG